MKCLVFLAALLLAAVVPSAPARADGEAPALDGTSWKIDVQPDAAAQDKVKPYQEILIFSDGYASFKEAEKSGFAAAAYTTSVEEKGRGRLFRTEQSSATEGTEVWTGAVHGKNIEGKMIFTRQDGSVLTYSFKGRKLD